MSKKLTKFEMAAIRRTAQNVKTMVNKRDKLEERIEKLTGEYGDILEMIDMWEAPIKKMTGGFTSEQVLNGDMEKESEEVEEEVDHSNVVWENPSRDLEEDEDSVVTQAGY